MQTWHLHIKGQVQGVGFRPFVYSLAREYQLKGWVNNTFDGVHVVFNADRLLASTFAGKIVEKAPALSRITGLSQYRIQQKYFDRFEIIHSTSEGEPSLLLTPDFALCEDCREELHSAKDRRYQYAFTTCTNCGPRYSIIDQLPYDRGHTTMEVFPMCPTCQTEYDSPSDRRYYSQTNSCADCGVEMSLLDVHQQEWTKQPQDILEQVLMHWDAGKIVAIKGIGGYLLTCDATNDKAVLELRKRKHRPSKPFALMFPHADIQQLFSKDKALKEVLTSAVSPIVLLEMGEQLNGSGQIAPGLNQVGILQPYAPLFEWLLARFERPIVATSANVSNSPIIYEDEKAVKDLAKIADFILTHNRKIVLPQDDSVIQFSPFKKQKIILRRSRGLAPSYINANLKLPPQNILAMGAMLKSTFSLLHRGNKYISQYLGDLEHFDTQQNYQHTIQHFLKLFQTQPSLILRDDHPDYPSSQYGDQLSNTWQVPIKKIQHHQAHFGAILGEHNLVHSQAPILGVIWDGTGLGKDGQIWGGEFFKYQQYRFQRTHHFDYFDFILGDKMPKEPRIAALSACWGIEGAEAILREKFSPVEWRIYNSLLQKNSRLQTSSVGRIFDALAALLGILDHQSYEGEAAMRLEARASAYFKKEGLQFSANYFEDLALDEGIPTQSLMTRIISDIQAGQAKDWIAAKFHYSLVLLVKALAIDFGILRH
ncbi:MAG: carbamoyltransferase HypF [Bacteroidota bacterium]